MLKSPATFPFPGSYALHVVAGQPELVRLLEWLGNPLDAGTNVLIAYPLRTGASGNTQLPLAELIDATPLNSDERIALTALEKRVAGKSRPRRADIARELYLRTRAVNSDAMLKLIDEGIRRRLLPEDAGRQVLGLAA